MNSIKPKRYKRLASCIPFIKPSRFPLRSSYLRINWRLSTILKLRKKGVWSNIFWHVKVGIFWSLFNILYNEIKRRYWKIPFGQNRQCKNTFLFLSWAPTHQSFTVNSRFLYELMHKVHFSKRVCRFFHFRFPFVFIRVYGFV